MCPFLLQSLSIFLPSFVPLLFSTVRPSSFHRPSISLFVNFAARIVMSRQCLLDACTVSKKTILLSTNFCSSYFIFYYRAQSKGSSFTQLWSSHHLIRYQKITQFYAKQIKILFIRMVWPFHNVSCNFVLGFKSRRNSVSARAGRTIGPC